MLLLSSFIFTIPLISSNLSSFKIENDEDLIKNLFSSSLFSSINLIFSGILNVDSNNESDDDEEEDEEEEEEEEDADEDDDEGGGVNASTTDVPLLPLSFVNT